MAIPKGYVRIRKDSIGWGFREEIKKALTVVAQITSSFEKEPKIISCWAEDDEFIGVPRGFYNQKLKHRGVDGEFQYSVGASSLPATEAIKLRDGQEPVVSGVVDHIKVNSFGGAVASIVTGGGKCHGKDTPILMYDGSIKMVQDIKVGDQLMGPDSKPRNVMSLASGRDNLYKIIPVKGDPFICNESHILSLRASYSKYGLNRGEILNVSIKEILSDKSRKFKHCLKLWRAGVDFEKKDSILDPYFVGLWIGDGSLRSPSITTKDIEIKDYVYNFADSFGLSIREDISHNGCPTLHITNGMAGGSMNIIRTALESFGLGVKKTIPRHFLASDSDSRKRLLAGLIDSDGYYHHGHYEIVTVSDVLSEQILFLCRSLGYSAISKKKKSTIKSTGFSGLYNRITISGDFSGLPILLDRKKPAARLQKKNVLNTGFSLESIGRGEYFGFEIDGDHLYLLGDFTVTHNTVLGFEIARRLGGKTLVVVYTSVLMEQWKKEVHKFFPHWRVGTLQADEVDIDDKDIVVGMLQTLYQKKYENRVYEEFGTILIDECHVTGAEEFSKILSKFSARAVVGLSGTLARKDRADNVILYSTGPIIKGPDVPVLEPEIFFVDTQFAWSTKIQEVDRARSKLLSSIPDSKERNEIIIRQTCKAAESGRAVLVLTERVAHAKALGFEIANRLKPLGLTVGVVVGETKKEDREAAYKCNVLVATIQLIATGFNEPRLDTLVFATPYQSYTQAVGRIRRVHPGKKKPFVLDLVDTKSKTAMILAQARFKKYLADGWKIHGLSCFSKEFLWKYKSQILEMQQK